MKAEQIDQALRQKFVTEDQRLVFWHDANAEFKSYVAKGFSGDLANVNVLDVASMGGLSAKLHLEREDRIGKCLVYTKGEQQPPEHDWLLDIRLYSSQFYADVASLWLEELGLNTLSMRDHLKARSGFMGSQERRRKLKKLIGSTDDEAALDLKMIAVVVDSPIASRADVLRAMCHQHVRDGVFDLNEPPEAIEVLSKWDLLDRFWELMQAEFAYDPEQPSVAALVRKLLVTELCHQTGGSGLDALAHHQLPSAKRGNAFVFLTHWRDSSEKAASYDAAAAAVAAEQNLQGPLESLSVDSIRSVFTFWDVEKMVVRSLRDLLLGDTHGGVADQIASVVRERKSGHWLAGPGSDDRDRQAIASAYGALAAASELFALHAASRDLLRFEQPGELLAAYQKDLYRYDRLYRQFYTCAKTASATGGNPLKTLADEVERVYDQGFLQPLGIEWSRLLDAGFLKSWSLESLPPQHEFYMRTVGPYLSGGDRKRAYVIISDAFRYEAARELVEQVNGKYRLHAEMSAMLGVLPSYTALGMASLLPHKSLAYNDSGDVRVDGKSAAGTAARSKQLATVGGIACQAKDLRAMTREEARELVRDTKVVYIYHNVIDDRGDKAASEHETFEAVVQCLRELHELVDICTNTLSAAKVWVTADHGFLYQEQALDETDKSKLSSKPETAVITKKRYVIGQGLGATSEAHHGLTEATACAEGGMEFWVPRAANRFHFTGGARFVHGGAMPQEVVVPLVVVSQLRGKQREATRSEKVSVQVLGKNHKITTPKYRFEVIQTEPVGERRLPITLRAAVYDGDQPVTSIETITLDSTSESLEERKKSIRFELRAGTFDKSRSYFLLLRDAENEAEVQREPVVIDRSFDDDF